MLPGASFAISMGMKKGEIRDGPLLEEDGVVFFEGWKPAEARAYW